MNKENILDTLNDVENKLDDLSQQCCLASYQVEDLIYEIQVGLDKLKGFVK